MPLAPGPDLLAWFHRYGRAFPWREPFPRDPYRTLVAEVMLQQTQATRATAAWQRFLAAFPTVEAAAAASEEAVLVPFSGLGYYRRARLLHAACRAVVEGGSWPRTAPDLRRLPGIGPYTAAALTAFCFGGADPPVDGNILRIAARVMALPGEKQREGVRRAADAFARTLHAEQPTPEVWEALMDLGAQLCRPTSPRCHACPLATTCRGHALGTPTAFPLSPRSRPAERTLWVALWVTRSDGRVLLQRRPPGSLLGGLWLPPLAPVDRASPTAVEVARRLARTLDLHGVLRPLPEIRHSITHRRLTVLPFALTHAGLRAADQVATYRWQPPTALELPTSSLLGKLRRAATTAPLPAEPPDGRYGLPEEA